MFGLHDPLFTTGYQMTPSLAVFFTPMTLLLLHLVRNGLVFTRVVYWMTPYFGEYTFYLIGPYFWLGVGTHLSLQIGSAPPRGSNHLLGHEAWYSINYPPPSYYSSNFFNIGVITASAAPRLGVSHPPPLNSLSA